MKESSIYKVSCIVIGNKCTVMGSTSQLVDVVFTARCYASAVLATALCLSVRLSVCLSRVGVLLKRLKVESHKQHHTIVQGL